MEEFRPVPGYEGLYWVSDQGRVKSQRKVLSQADGQYLSVGLHKDRIQRTERVHRLVLGAFRGPRPEGQVARHLNGDAHDNRLENLVWGTQSENVKDAIRHGTWVPSARTHCPQGHPYDDENTGWVNGKRRCRTCIRDRNREAYRENAEERKRKARESYRKTYEPKTRPERTHCLHGHPYDDENTRWVNGRNGTRHRKCRACDRENQRRYRAG